MLKTSGTTMWSVIREDFDDFSDVDDLYNSLPLDKVESLEDLVTIGPLGLVKGAPVHSLKTSLATSAPQIPATVASPHHESAVVQDQADDTASQDSNSGIVARTPPAKSSMVGLSAPSTPTGNHAPISVNVQAQTLPGNSMKEEEVAGFPGRISSPSLADAGLARGISRGGLSNQPSSSIPLSPGVVPSNGALGSVPLASDIAKRNILGTDDRLGSGGMVQPLASSSNRMILPQAGKAGDGTSAVDSSSGWQSFLSFGHWHAMETWEFFSKSERTAISSMQWMLKELIKLCYMDGPKNGILEMLLKILKFQFAEPICGQFRARTEIAPDQREKFLQRLQQVQQQGHSNILGMPPLTGGNHKQFSAQQNPLLQQFNSQSSSVSQASLGHGVQASGFNAVTSAALQQTNSIHQQSSQQVVMSSGAKDAGTHSSVYLEFGNTIINGLPLIP
ncbi:CCR4 NOT-RELATED [Salix purpurea]|uniref:CCR4 NOT-RELATED n=1 Tax=Salix purpurea TaxID=77065 RepID=A0A9Q1A9G2_SALPP|nr:CCR4 NOT-RELATED [Salix purpurea]